MSERELLAGRLVDALAIHHCLPVMGVHVDVNCLIYIGLKIESVFHWSSSGINSKLRKISLMHVFYVHIDCHLVEVLEELLKGHEKDTIICFLPADCLLQLVCPLAAIVTISSFV